MRRARDHLVSSLHGLRLRGLGVALLCACASASPMAAPASAPLDDINDVPAGQCNLPNGGVAMSYLALSDLMVGCIEDTRPLKVDLMRALAGERIAVDDAAELRKANGSLIWRATYAPLIAGGGGFTLGAIIVGLIAGLLTR